MKFSAWLLFVVVNAVYSGALTMFFTSDMSLPFESFTEGMGKFPDWKPVLQSVKIVLIHENKLAMTVHFLELPLGV